MFVLDENLYETHLTFDYIGERDECRFRPLGGSREAKRVCQLKRNRRGMNRWIRLGGWLLLGLLGLWVVAKVVAVVLGFLSWLVSTLVTLVALALLLYLVYYAYTKLSGGNGGSGGSRSRTRSREKEEEKLFE